MIIAQKLIGTTIMLYLGAFLQELSLSGLAAFAAGVPRVGMLAGKDGLGDIKFDCLDPAYLVSTPALTAILFQGG